MVYSNPAVCGGNEFYFFEALNDAFEVLFFRASFLHLINDTDYM